MNNFLIQGPCNQLTAGECSREEIRKSFEQPLDGWMTDLSRTVASPIIIIFFVAGIESKAGKCPPATRTLCPQQQNDGCFADFECPGNKKCCDNSCGYTACMDPVSGENTWIHCALIIYRPGARRIRRNITRGFMPQGSINYILCRILKASKLRIY